jgi:hypothetical protein
MDQLTFTPQLGLIVGGVVGLLIGWIIGFFDSNNRTAKKIQSAEANAAIAMKEAENKIAEANQRLAEIPAQQPVTVQDDPGLLRLKNNGGYFALEMDGAPVRNALAPDEKRRLIELLTVIRPYLEGGLPPQAPAMPAPAPRPAMPAPRPAPMTAFAAPAAPAAETLAPDGTPKTLINPDDKKVMASLGMIAQIDAILQWRLATSTFARRGIRVTESPEGGVHVEVGLEKFEAVDDVTDPEVKAFIKASIAEWEKKFTPGL